MTKQMDLKALLESKMGSITPMEETQTAIERAETVVPKNLMFDSESTEFKPETKAVTATTARGLTVEEAKQFDDDMNRFIDTVLISGVDYGVIPHCNKPTLLKSGAEKIMNYLGLIARTEVVNRVEDYNTGFFSYECKVYLIDYNGVVKGEGVGICNSREGRYAKQNGYAVQNTVLKMTKKRALVDAALNVGNLSARFTQDVEDMNLDAEQSSGARVVEELRSNNNTSSAPKTERPASKKQIYFLETLMGQRGTTVDAMNRYVSQQYGVDDYGSEVAVDSTLLQIKKVSLDDEDGFINDLFRCVTVDFANAKLYSLAYASNTVTIKRYRIPVFDIGLNERLDDSTLTLEDTTVLQCSTFKFYGSYTPYGIFMDGGDGYWYGFSNQGNSSGSATVLWIKIKKSDYTFTEGSWTLSNAALMTVGSFREGSSYPSGSRNAVVRNGYLYVPSYDKTGVYKINISNSTDVTLIPLGFTSAMKCIGETGSTDCCLSMINDIIIAYDFEIDVNDNVIATLAGEHCGNVSTPFFQYKEYVFAWGGAYLNQYRYTWLLTPYLATICNLSQAVVKNADKTMKITYTLTEQDAS